MTRKSTEIRQEEIKKAVLKIIGKEGIKSISTKKLAQYTGLSEGAIFRHFKSKREIILSIIEDVSNNMIGALTQIAHSDLPPKERLFELICTTIQYLTEHNGITILLFTEASQSNDAEMKEKLNHIFNSQRALVGRVIQDGINQGIWDKNISIPDVTLFYMGIPITHNINLILSDSKSHTHDFCNRMITLFERILH